MAKPNKQRVFEYEVQCPKCAAPMKLRNSTYGFFYGCTQWPECSAIVDAADNGTPKG